LGIYRLLLATVGFYPSEVTLASFEAAVMADRVLLTWETEVERYVEGFDLYRVEHGDASFVRLNQDLIPSTAPEGPAGASYGFVDTSAVTGTTYHYWIEYLDLNGLREECGYITVEVPLVRNTWSSHVFLPLIAR
jgi:hypothetical protein